MKHARKCQGCGIHYSEDEAVAVQTDPGYDKGHNDAEPPSYEPGCPTCKSIHSDIDGEFCESCGEWMETVHAIDEDDDHLCEACFKILRDDRIYLVACPTCHRIVDFTMLRTDGKTCLHCQFDEIQAQIKNIINQMRGLK